MTVRGALYHEPIGGRLVAEVLSCLANEALALDVKPP